ncbi:MAG: hypothetical protein E6J90_19055 [Deltaproteobacteria bacterium]|nr:MAG: hypothetical protein E6J91_07380 [Deltaproteobacteria bacterium]TMQ18967.1 MAG: hypothetical protein E6J90_19055 [Deltaproteobacteria bacterium]
MQDTRWLRLKDCLVDRGWTSRDNAMYAPHHTMWFTRSSDDANLTVFRDRITVAARASAAYIDIDVEHAALHLDLVSLADALDEAIDGGPKN